MSPINNNPSVVQIMAWCGSGDKPLYKPMMVSLPTHICVTRPQWVNKQHPYLLAIGNFVSNSMKRNNPQFNHWNENIINLSKFSPLSATSDENFINMTPPFQCWIRLIMFLSLVYAEHYMVHVQHTIFVCWCWIFHQCCLHYIGFAHTRVYIMHIGNKNIGSCQSLDTISLRLIHWTTWYDARWMILLVLEWRHMSDMAFKITGK